MKILIVSDCLLTATVNVEYQNDVSFWKIETGILVGQKVMIRHLSYLLLALKTVFFAKKYDHIIFWQQYIGIYYSILARVLRIEKKCSILPLIYTGGGGGKKTLYKQALKYQYSKYYVFSTKERDTYYEIFTEIENTNKVEFIEFGLEPSSFIEGNYCKENIKDYIFSGGTSNRDYKLLLEVARKLPDTNFIIACTTSDIKNISIPSNVFVKHGFHGDDFEKLLLEAKAVLIPLKESNISSGQLVIFRAMQAAKPIIVALHPGVTDYVKENMVYFYKINNEHSLYSAIRLFLSNSRVSSSKDIDLRDEYFKKYSSHPINNLLRIILST